MEKYVKNADGNAELEDSEEFEEDEAQIDPNSVTGKKERIQLINVDIKKLLEESDELERQVLDLEDDLEDRKI